MLKQCLDPDCIHDGDYRHLRGECLKASTDEIFDRNTNAKPCIVCGLYAGDTGVRTVHGWYHYECMDGR